MWFCLKILVVARSLANLGANGLCSRMVATASISFGLVACQADVSEQKSLENLAYNNTNSQFVGDRCLGTYPIDRSLKVDYPDKVHGVLEKALSSVPYGLQGLLSSKAVGLQIHVLDDIKTDCGQSNFSSIGSDPDHPETACAVRRSDGGVSLYFRATDEAIGKDFVRMIGFAVGSILPKMRDGQFIANQPRSQEFENFVQRLTNAFVAERDALGIKGASGLRLDQIKDSIIADAFDSYYCNAASTATKSDTELEQIKQTRGIAGVVKESKNTRQRMKILFPQTYCEFESTIPQVFETASRPIDPICRAPSGGSALTDSPEGFSLQNGQLGFVPNGGGQAGVRGGVGGGYRPQPQMNSKMMIFAALLPMLGQFGGMISRAPPITGGGGLTRSNLTANRGRTTTRIGGG